MFRPVLAAACGLGLLPGLLAAQEKAPVEMTLVLNKDTYAWPYEKDPKAFEASLQDLLKRRKMLEEVRFPAPPAIDLVLKLTNKGKERVTVYIDGDVNVLTLQLKGPGVVTVDPGFTFTAELRPPKPTDIEPGQSVDVPVKYLADGFRRMSRYVYPTAAGEYTLSATYQLATPDGAKGPVVKGNEVKLKFEDKK
jgi:hypothetical protein